MKRILIAASLALASCTTTSLPGPAIVANATTLDEEGAIRAEEFYQAAGKIVLNMNRFGLIPAAAKPRVAQAESVLYAAVLAVRAAYDAGNAESYASAKQRVDAAASDFLKTIRS